MIPFTRSTYHEFAKKLGDKFVKPDLTVAFNSGASMEDVALWQPTIEFLVQSGIPTVFTVSLIAVP